MTFLKNKPSYFITTFYFSLCMFICSTLSSTWYMLDLWLMKIQIQLLVYNIDYSLSPLKFSSYIFLGAFSLSLITFFLNIIHTINYLKIKIIKFQSKTIEYGVVLLF